MPIIKSAKKKLKQDKKRQLLNKVYVSKYKQAIRNLAKNKKGKDALKSIYSLVDKAVKKKIIKKEKAARLKSRAAKFLKK